MLVELGKKNQQHSILISNRIYLFLETLNVSQFLNFEKCPYLNKNNKDSSETLTQFSADD
jgi:hypothetical protein